MQTGNTTRRKLPKLIKPIIDNKADLGLGSRLENLKYEMQWVKKQGNKAFTWLLRRLTGADIKDGQTGFRVTSECSGEFLSEKRRRIAVDVVSQSWIPL